MIKKIIFCCFCFFILKSVGAQTGGYMGKIHHFSVGVNYHPFTNIRLNDIFLDSYNNPNLEKNNSISFRPGYEIVLGKSFSIGIDAGYLFYSGGEVQNGATETTSGGSILFNTNNTNTNTNTTLPSDPKFYVSGFDFKLKLNIYNYRSRGLIAPLGGYFSFIIGRPFYNTSFSETAVFKYTKLGFGIECGKRYILSRFFTIDYGISIMASSYESNVFNGTETEENYYRSLSSIYEVESDYSQMQSFSIYLKIGYLL